MSAAEQAVEEKVQEAVEEKVQERNDVPIKAKKMGQSRHRQSVRCRPDSDRGGHRQSLLGLVPIGEADEETGEGSLVVYDEITYKADGLLGMGAIFHFHRSIWTSMSLWIAMLKLVTLSVIVAVITVLTVSDPASLKVEVFASISKFLSVFSGLMLGFFMTNSVTRWRNCAQGFLELCDAIRNLQMQFMALGVTPAKYDMCIRYGILSGWLLKSHLEAEHVARKHGLAQEKWDEFLAEPDQGNDLGHSPKLLPCELDVLRTVKDPAAGLWTWISSLIGRMAQDGEVPPMQSPTYGRIMNLAQDAHNGIRHVRSSISIRAPFVYVQLLTSLVHINNVMNAIALGIVSGVAISEVLIRRGLHYHTPKVSGNESERDLQFFLVTSIMCALGPLLYHALIEISVCLATPFASDFGKIPIHRLLMLLEEDLKDTATMSDANVKWQKACFKQASQPPAPPKA